MNIMFLVSSLQFGGAERVATTLCNSWIKRGHQVTLVATYSGVDPCFFSLDPAIDVRYLANEFDCMFGKSKLSFARLYKLRQMILKNKPDVVLSFLPSANIMAILATVGLTVPVVVSERTDPEFFPQPLIWKKLCKHLYQYADVLTVQTDAVAKKVPNLFNNIDQVRVVANPLPFARQQFKKSSIAAGKTIVSLGRLTESKQTDQLIAAFVAVAADFPEWVLKIYGDGPCRRELEHLVSTCAYKSQIEFCGDTKDPWNRLVEADIFMMTSRFEGFPNALLEALGLAVPAVVYDCPSGPAEITEQGQIARLVPLNAKSTLAEVLRELMANEQLRIQLGANAEAAVHAKYNLETVVQIWEDIFQSLK
jgi:GalNAc-alpha-(1->4)-GalNAc-alpha-(1->3)-diNAcBac-PP-undecaprenol alpha-1,4-N-acetyl-D-galactosaminyltransferase